MKILTIADKEEEKFLRTQVADFDFKKYSKKGLEEIIRKMRQIMIKAPGIGLSANQVGLDLRLFVVQIPKTRMDADKNTDGYKYAEKFYAILNPKIKVGHFSRKKIKMEEGCLSMPGIYGLVERPEKITLTGFDKNGRKIKIKAEGLLARVFQHEVDHLNGILFIDKAKNIYKIQKS